jgi:type I pantothenate kinase
MPCWRRRTLRHDLPWCRARLGVVGGHRGWQLTPTGTADSDGFVVYTREQWVESGRASLTKALSGSWSLEVAEGEPVDPGEVQDVYIPLAGWIGKRLGASTSPGPAILGITGSVAVGKSTTARILQGLLALGPGRPTVELLATDGFLYPNRELERRGILDRKGFPESYDHRELVEALEAVRSGRADVSVPVYSHSDYDILPGEGRLIGSPGILIVEGLTVLQTAPESPSSVVTDIRSLVDLAVYVDAAEEDVARWHTERLMALRSAGGDKGGFLGWLSSLTDAEAHQVATASWSGINLVNLREYVAPTRDRADVILEKDRHHRVERILLRSSADADDGQGRTGSVGQPIRSTPSRTNSELRSGPQMSVRTPRAN